MCEHIVTNMATLERSTIFIPASDRSVGWLVGCTILVQAEINNYLKDNHDVWCRHFGSPQENFVILFSSSIVIRPQLFPSASAVLNVKCYHADTVNYDAQRVMHFTCEASAC